MSAFEEGIAVCNCYRPTKRWSEFSLGSSRLLKRRYDCQRRLQRSWPHQTVRRSSRRQHPTWQGETLTFPFQCLYDQPPNTGLKHLIESSIVIGRALSVSDEMWYYDTSFASKKAFIAVCRLPPSLDPYPNGYLFGWISSKALKHSTLRSHDEMGKTKHIHLQKDH